MCGANRKSRLVCDYGRVGEQASCETRLVQYRYDDCTQASVSGSVSHGNEIIKTERDAVNTDESVGRDEGAEGSF